MTDACRRTVLRPKFTKFGEHLSIGQIPIHTKPHRDPPNAVREKGYSLFTPSLFWRPRGTSWAKVRQSGWRCLRCRATPPYEVTV